MIFRITKCTRSLTCNWIIYGYCFIMQLLFQFLIDHRGDFFVVQSTKTVKICQTQDVLINLG